MNEQEMTVAQEIQLILDGSRGEIAELEAQMEKIKQRIDTVRGHTARVIEKYLPEVINPDERLDLASDIYWLYNDLIPAWAIAPSLGVKPGAVYMKVRPFQIDADCVECGKPSPVIVTSRTELIFWQSERKGGRALTVRQCADCKAKSDASENDEYEQEQALRRAYLHNLKTMPYKDYLQTEHWLDLRRRMLKRAHYRCQVCNKNEESLHVHHRTYERRGQEEYTDLIVLCATCHQTFHETGRLAK